MRPSRRHPRLTPPRAALASAAVGVLCAALLTPAAHAVQAAAPGSGPATARSAPGGLYLVTLRTPGTSAVAGALGRTLDTARVVREQDAVLDALAGLDAPPPVYRWTTALNGFAVRLDAEQAARVASLPQVRSVERDTVRPVADATALPTRLTRPATVTGPERGGAGVVIGVVDTGLAPDSPVFAQRSALRTPATFGGGCETTPDWHAAECSGKVVGARTYVAGFGEDHLRAATSVSPRDLDGHGTRTASLAAGNALVPVVVDGERLGTFGGQAPDAQLAIYKACWSAPDPADDGCSAADLVSAVDDATREGVDVLTLAVGGPSEVDTLERALLGASEAGVVVVGAAGNDGTGSVAHTSPWVTTVGGTDGDVRRGEVVLSDGRSLAGAMQSRRSVGTSRLVLAGTAAADGASADDARVCTPGSLDASRVAGAVVVCERGRVGRVDKSRAVALADGTGMVLLNSGPGSVDADLHSVPTVHLAAAPARRLRAWLASDPSGRVRLRPLSAAGTHPRVASFSGSGDGAGTHKPDLVAPSSSVLAAVPDAAGSWEVASGTSAATAHTAGVAALLLGRGKSPAVVRSALVTTALPLRDGVLRGGTGLLRPAAAADPGLAYVVEDDDYRAWLDEGKAGLNTPSVVLSGGQPTTTRRVTNVTGRRLYFSSSTEGFRRDVAVRPAAVRLGPGESVTFRVQVSARGRSRLDDGYVVWRGATGTVTRIPVVLTR
jgi:minor extracellular serine protease Vpr